MHQSLLKAAAIALLGIGSFLGAEGAVLSKRVFFPPKLGRTRSGREGTKAKPFNSDGPGLWGISNKHTPAEGMVPVVSPKLDAIDYKASYSRTAYNVDGNRWETISFKKGSQRFKLSIDREKKTIGIYKNEDAGAFVIQDRVIAYQVGLELIFEKEAATIGMSNIKIMDVRKGSELGTQLDAGRARMEVGPARGGGELNLRRDSGDAKEDFAFNAAVNTDELRAMEAATGQEISRLSNTATFDIGHRNFVEFTVNAAL